jgi:hypothetical protein
MLHEFDMKCAWYFSSFPGGGQNMHEEYHNTFVREFPVGQRGIYPQLSLKMAGKMTFAKN